MGELYKAFFFIILLYNSKFLLIFMSDNDYKIACELMEEGLKKGDGYVGIFWYSPVLNQLFGVYKEKTFEASRAEGGLVTCSLLHKNLWKKEFNKQKFSGSNGLFIGDYKDKPRGRIFYSPTEDKFYVMVGSWIKEGENYRVIDLIIDEFGLENENYEIDDTKQHWDIGMGYGD